MNEQTVNMIKELVTAIVADLITSAIKPGGCLQALCQDIEQDTQNIVRVVRVFLEEEKLTLSDIAYLLSPAGEEKLRQLVRSIKQSVAQPEEG